MATITPPRTVPVVGEGPSERAPITRTKQDSGHGRSRDESATSAKRIGNVTDRRGTLSSSGPAIAASAKSMTLRRHTRPWQRPSPARLVSRSARKPSAPRSAVARRSSRAVTSSHRHTTVSSVSHCCQPGWMA